MTQIRIYSNHLPHQDQWAKAFYDGCKKHGLEAQRLASFDYRPSDIAVVWGQHQHSVVRGQKRHGGRLLYLERGYLGERTKWTAAGWGGINGHADFRNKRSPADRWMRWHPLKQPYRRNGDYILIMGQVPGDSALRNVDIARWYGQVVDWAHKQTDMPIAFRPHPYLRHFNALPNVRQLSGTLEQAIAQAALVVTYNSSSAVASVLAGVPTIAIDRGSVAYEVTDHELTLEPTQHAREQWAYNLAYAQWNEGEFRSGLVWEHLRDE